MDYGSEEENAGGGGGGGGMWSRAGEQTELEFLHQQQREALVPLKEDLSDWLNKLLGIDINEETFLDTLDSGVHVCKLAKLIQTHAEEAVKEGRIFERLPRTKLRFKENARSGTWFARDNIANFIRWCREYGIKEEYMFETEGLVTHSTERNFVLCLLELGRLAYKFGMEAPTLVVMEKEIDRLEQGSCFGDESFTSEQELNTQQRDSRIPVRRASISVMTSNSSFSESSSIGTVTEEVRERSKSRSKSRSPSQRRRSVCSADNRSMSPLYIDTRLLSPSPPRRSPSPKRSIPSPRSSIPSPRSGIPSPRSIPSPRNSPRGVPSPRHLLDAATETSSSEGSPYTKRRSTTGTSTSGTDTSDFNGQVSPRGVTSTGTGTERANGTAVGTLTDDTFCGVKSIGTRSKSDTSRYSPNIGVGKSSARAVDTGAGTGSNGQSTVDGTYVNGASTGTSSPRSVWRRSSSPHTKIPVPTGTSAHGTLSRGVSSSSINSIGTPVNGNSTPKSIRRRFSTAGTINLNGDTPRSVLSGTKTPRRRSMSNKSDKSDELDKEMEPPRKKVRRISGRCQCPQCYQIDRLSEGKYRIGERVVFVRLLKGKHVMVRVGGGWDTLDHYLATHDPCRIMEVRRDPSCHSLTQEDDKFLFIHGKYKRFCLRCGSSLS